MEFQKSWGIGTIISVSDVMRLRKRAAEMVGSKIHVESPCAPLSIPSHKLTQIQTQTQAQAHTYTYNVHAWQSTWFTNCGYVNGSFHATIKQQQQLNENRWHFFPSYTHSQQYYYCAKCFALLFHQRNNQPNKTKTPIHWIDCQLICCLHLA